MESFWSKVEKTDYCWIWIAGKNRGYGRVRYEGKLYQAHRLVWYLTYGFFPKKWMLHKCNNRKCVNPDHLYDGTPKQNTQDAIIAGTFYNIGKKTKGKIFTNHGTITMYSWHKCRCNECKKAKSIALKRQRLRRQEESQLFAE